MEIGSEVHDCFEAAEGICGQEKAVHSCCQYHPEGMEETQEEKEPSVIVNSIAININLVNSVIMHFMVSNC